MPLPSPMSPALGVCPAKAQHHSVVSSSSVSTRRGKYSLRGELGSVDSYCRAVLLNSVSKASGRMA